MLKSAMFLGALIAGLPALAQDLPVCYYKIGPNKVKIDSAGRATEKTDMNQVEFKVRIYKGTKRVEWEPTWGTSPNYPVVGYQLINAIDEAVEKIQKLVASGECNSIY